ncbi:MAG: TIGR03032 family protein [Cyanophyceae cyanobacterium]
MNDNSAAQSPLRSVHTTNFPFLLDHLDISLVVSTYQAGKLIVLRSDGSVINTHFRTFNKPMGLAVSREKIALGTAYQIWELRNVPAVAQRIDPPGKHDACYLPHKIHTTGDIDIHEMAFAQDELWFVNTRFSCLCTLDARHSFVPRWRPPFISGYDLTDRCHLNGLGIRDGQPKYVTALGTTDTPAGWRDHKAYGGILMDIETNQILCQGLSMPHSPRWYANQLWVLESGVGSLSRVDAVTGKREVVTHLPSFTRGLDFWGEWGFVGLSQVRETAVFSGIPITETEERICGVWVINLRSGQIVAFLRFEEGVQEIFAVQVIPNTRFPEIIDWDESLLGSSFVLPDEALQEVVPPLTQPREPNVYLSLGNHAYHKGNWQEALQHYQHCLELDPSFTVARYNLGVICLEQERWSAAREFLHQVVNLEPHHADAYNNLGIIAHRQLYLEEAIAHFRQAIQRRERFPDAHFNLGMTLLLQGELKEGFAESEWRWQTQQFTPFVCRHPRWDGSNIEKQTILIHTEQGAGDAIQFIRYLPLVRSRCRRLLLCCPENLVSLFATITAIDTIYTPGEIPLSEFHTYAPLMSLPHLLGTTLNSIPATVPYVGEGLNQFPLPPAEGKKIGIVWSGSPTHKNDRHRSCSLKQFLPVLKLTNCTFYSLQKGPRTEELTHLSPQVSLVDLSPHLTNFAATARIILSLDLVISVDTAVVHLAGGLGKPVWTLLSFCPDWRWMLYREDSPWYPTMRLFRQRQPQQWEAVFAEVVETLMAEIS